MVRLFARDKQSVPARASSGEKLTETAVIYWFFRGNSPRTPGPLQGTLPSFFLECSYLIQRGHITSLRICSVHLCLLLVSSLYQAFHFRQPSPALRQGDCKPATLHCRKSKPIKDQLAPRASHCLDLRTQHCCSQRREYGMNFFEIKISKSYR